MQRSRRLTALCFRSRHLHVDVDVTVDVDESRKHAQDRTNPAREQNGQLRGSS